MAGESVLVIDDGKEMREFIVDYILKPNNFVPLVAENGLIGLEMIREHKPDLILLDLQMPRMNGMQVLDAMNEHGIDIPVILMTLHGSEEIAVEVYRKGVRDYVKKPYTADEMLAAIERSLGEIRLRKEKDALTERLISANKDLNQRLRELNTLYKLGKSVTALMPIDELLPRVVRAVVEVSGGEECSVYLLEGNQVICRARKVPDDNQIYIQHQSSDDPFAHRTIQQGQAMLVNPAEMQAHRQKNPSLPMAVMCCPMVIGERVIGAMQVSAVSQPRNFRKQDIAMLTALTDYVAIAVENAANFSKISRHAGSEHASVRQILGRFVSPQLIDALLHNPDFEVESAYTEAAIMFVALRGYHNLLEHVASARLIEFLNQYTALASHVIGENYGMVDRYLGDGMLAFFNTPDQHQDYIMQAARSALQLQESVQELNDDLGVEGISFSIVIHTGVVIGGNIGVLNGVNYTVLGEPVELAHHIHTRARPGQIVISQSYKEKLGQQAQVNALGEVQVQGRGQAVFELLALR